MVFLSLNIDSVLAYSVDSDQMRWADLGIHTCILLVFTFLEEYPSLGLLISIVHLNQHVRVQAAKAQSRLSCSNSEKNIWT